MGTQNLTAYDEQLVKEYGWTKSQLDIVKNLYCKGCKDEEVKVFAHICKHTKLDPFLKQIYAIPRGNRMTVQTSIDGYRLIAERTGRYSPGRETSFVEKGDTLISATAYVKKMTPDGTWHEVAATAYFREFCGDNLWKKMPHVMLAKCAEAQALRRAFPAELSAIYTKEELDQAGDSIDVQVETVKPQFSNNPEIPESSKVQTISDEQLNILEISLEKCTDSFVNSVDKNIKKMFGAENRKDIPEEAFDRIMNGINIHIKAQEMKYAQEESNV